jgi:hypothetical protein
MGPFEQAMLTVAQISPTARSHAQSPVSVNATSGSLHVSLAGVLERLLGISASGQVGKPALVQRTGPGGLSLVVCALALGLGLDSVSEG